MVYLGEGPVSTELVQMPFVQLYASCRLLHQVAGNAGQILQSALLFANEALLPLGILALPAKFAISQPTISYYFSRRHVY